MPVGPAGSSVPHDDDIRAGSPDLSETVPTEQRADFVTTLYRNGRPVLDARGLTTTEATRTRITACTDITRLRTRHTRAVTAADVDAVFS